MFFRKVLFEPSNLTWLPWHETLVRGVFGRTDAQTGMRITRTAFVSTAKKNGKSAILGGMPVAHLMLEDREVSRHAIGAATTRRQAREVFDSAAMMVRNSPLLRDKIDITPSRSRMTRWDGAGEYEVISCEGQKTDGCRPSFWVIDEIHCFRSEAEGKTIENLRRGTRGRVHPIGVYITTAGDPDQSIAWRREYEYAKQVDSGAINAPSYFPLIYEADADRVAREPDYWESKEARLAANPSHEDYGGFVKDSELLEDLARAKEIPAERRGYLRYTLNVPAASEDKYIPEEAWKQCGTIPQRSLIGRRCYLGLDLSLTTDLTAMVAVFPDESDHSYDVLAWFWMASEQLAVRQRLDRQPYDVWVRNGFIEVTEGKVINYDAVVDRIRWCMDNFEVAELCYDPAHAKKLTTEVLQHMVTCVPVRQGFAQSEELKHVASALLEGKLRHGNNPVLSWNAACVRAKVDGQNNVALAKPTYGRDSARIDGISALVTAMNRAMYKPVPEPEPIY